MWGCGPRPDPPHMPIHLLQGWHSQHAPRSGVTGLSKRDEEAVVPERKPYLWWLGLRPIHHRYGSLLWARGIFIALLLNGQPLHEHPVLPQQRDELRVKFAAVADRRIGELEVVAARGFVDVQGKAIRPRVGG